MNAINLHNCIEHGNQKTIEKCIDELGEKKKMSGRASSIRAIAPEMGKLTNHSTYILVLPSTNIWGTL